jgi:hypothetical protein
VGRPPNDLVAIGGACFGIMAIIVAVERGCIECLKKRIVEL